MQSVRREVATGHLKDLKKSRRVQWAGWNYSGKGHQWPKKTYKDALLEGKCNARKGSDEGLQKALKDHWEQLPESFRNQCTAMGLQMVETTVTPDLPSLIKEAVEKIVEPDKPDPTIATKVKQAVGTLKQLTERKNSLQTKVDSVKAQYTQLLQDLKELQGKIEVVQKELQTTTQQYNQQLEQEKQKDAETMAEDLTPEALVTAMASVGLQATSARSKT